MIDRESDSWKDVAAFIDEAIYDAEQRLYSPSLDFPGTQLERGRLMALKSVRDLPLHQRRAANSFDTTVGDY